MAKFSVGDRVVRPKDIYKEGSGLLRGLVVLVYSESTRRGHYPEVYDVQWDGEHLPQKGFLPHGLEHEGRGRWS